MKNIKLLLVVLECFIDYLFAWLSVGLLLLLTTLMFIYFIDYIRNLVA